MKTYISILAAAIISAVSAAPSFAADQAPELFASDADARALISIIEQSEGLITPAQYFSVFGGVSDDRNIGADMYRNIIWKFPLVSIDVTLDMNVGFNYGKAADWSAVMDFGDRADVSKKYFSALCRGLERATSHVSRITRFEHPRADTEVCAYYPLSGDREGRMIEVSSADDDRHGIIFVTLVPATAAQRTMVRIHSGDVSMYAYPDASADVVRTLAPGKLIFSMETKSVQSSQWTRLIDGDGEIGWIRASDADEVGVFTLSNAFEKIGR